MLNTYQSIIHKSRYARYLENEQRRESWEETVNRYMAYIRSKIDCSIERVDQDLNRCHEAILNLKVMPSMRLMMTAGEACERDNIAAYNCAYLAVNNKRAFSEALYILMNGTGVGFSCERQEISKLPRIPNDFRNTDDTIVVGDSKLGWAKAFRKLLSSLWEGDVPKIDYSRVRPAGQRLRTFGGRASGPAPLRRLFDYCIEVFEAAKGRNLNSLEVHDIMCMIGEIVVVGGVRRSALISLSNLTDRRMREAKTGAWWEDNPQRALANNSIAYTEKPDSEAFMEEWLSLVKSKSGERGIFNRVAAQNQAKNVGRDPTKEYGCNPCSEIILRDKEFCNLTEIICRVDDTYESLKEKAELATILGTIQSSLTNFQFLSEDWKKNCEEERLLGVSMTGIMDCGLLNGTQYNGMEWEEDSRCITPYDNTHEILHDLRQHCKEVNNEYSKILGINSAAAITCVKPSGTVSELVGSSSGIHPRYSPYYIRSVRQDNKDPVTSFLKEKGIKWEPAFGKEESTTVFYFPQSSPNNSVYRNDRTAIQQLEHWLLFQRYWCDHKPSVTIYVKDDEWLEVGAWVYKHFDEVSGVSFLPYSDHSYQQAPFNECTEQEWELLLSSTPSTLDWSTLVEKDDLTIASQELACTAGGCSI